MLRVSAIFVVLTAEWMLAEAGRPEEAITWLLSRGKAGDDRASEAVFEVLEKARRTEKAIAFHLQATEVGDPSTGAIILCQAAEAGDPSALEAAAWMLEDAGRIEEAARLRLYGLEPGGRIADPWEAPAPT